jgi:sugar-specific transcriptional regulator TrmB
MTDEELNRKFDLVAAHLASLAVSQQKAEERQREWDKRQREWDKRQRELDARQRKGQDRISRAERILLLAIRAGRRERKEWRERHAALIDSQIRTDDKIAKLTESQARTDATLAESRAHTDAALAESGARTDAALAELAKSQVHTDRKLDALIDIVRGERGEGSE